MNQQVTLYAAAARGSNGEPGLPVAVLTMWAALRALSGEELDKAQQIAQKVTHLVAVPYQQGIAENMLLGFADDVGLRTFQIAYVYDPVGEEHRELRMLCWELGQNAGALSTEYIPTPEGNVFSRYYPGQSPNGVLTTFTFAGTAGSNLEFELFWNGLLQDEGPDYSITIGGGVTTVTMTLPPQTGDKLIAYF